MADLLGDENLPPEKKHAFLNNMRTGLNRMEWLVLTLLKLARLDAGAVDFKRESVLLSELVERGLAALAIPIEIRELSVNKSGEDAAIVCDADWTAEALGNILKNAVEITPPGGKIDMIPLQKL